MNSLFQIRQDKDDILIVKNGLLTDTSIANIALYDGNDWYTPLHPLLKGTKRAELLDKGVLKEKEIKYHTATHLLNAALKVVVNKDIHQKGSNITSERMRFDFSCDHKLTDEEKQKTEQLVNKWISEGLDVTVTEMSKEQALKSGAECMFIEKYPDIVTVYSIGDVSKELCGGPHVKNTSELGKFKIVKEEASSAGVRRIKAILE